MLTATFRNLDVPEGTPVFFRVVGANTEFLMRRTDADGTATFSYVGSAVGNDTITATAAVGDEIFVSNEATITWAVGQHTTYLTLNASPTSSIPALPAVVTAVLLDTAVEPDVPVVGATVTFSRGAAECTAVTDADGRAACPLLAEETGLAPLTATFEGGSGLLPATASIGFNVLGDPFLGPFTLYATKPAPNAPKLVKFGPVTLTDEIDDAAYDVVARAELGLPARTSAGDLFDPATHLVAYPVKRAKSAAKFVKRSDVHFLNQCSDSVLTLGKPVRLLVPSALDLAQPATPPIADAHAVDHFLCYQAKTQKKRADGSPAPAFRKGIQVDVEDAFETVRYDLGKVVLACNPVAKSGVPVVLAGPAKGTAFPITPAVIRDAEQHLLCYRAKVATKRIEQPNCGPTTRNVKGTKIVPKQQRHTPRLGVHLADQLGASRVDTKKATLLCLPSLAAP